MFEVLLDGDRASALDEPSVLRAARELLDDAVRHGAARRILRAKTIITRGGKYDGALTVQARGGPR